MQDKFYIIMVKVNPYFGQPLPPPPENKFLIFYMKTAPTILIIFASRIGLAVVKNCTNIGK